MAAVSILISSNARQSLLDDCLRSITEQNLGPHSLSVAISIPQNIKKAFELELDRKYSQLNVNWMRNQSQGPHTGRNWGIQKSPGDILHLIDEDVIYPDPLYIQRLVAYHRSLKNVNLLGGYYLSNEKCSPAGKAYNLVTQLWLNKGRHFNRDLLVAGNLSLKLNKVTRSLLFSSTNTFGGEEKDFLSRHWSGGSQSRLVEDLNVIHQSQHSFKMYFQRAWLHGKTLDQERSLTKQNLKHFYHNSGKGGQRLLVGSYLACTRISRRLKTL